MARAGTRMDPALLELIAAGDPGDEVAVIVRMRPGSLPPSALRIVACFGDIATGRAPRGQLVAIHDDHAVESLKAPRVYAGEADNPFADRPPPAEPGPSEADPAPLESDLRRPPGLVETGRGTVVAVIDWGLDFAHADFRRDDGGTRLLALWDQRAPGRCARYGYGRIHTRAEIDRALATADPFGELGYVPGETHTPSHGTHVAGIAAGNGRAGGPAGVAPEADLVFAHLGPGLGDLGNSIDLLEAIDFAVRTAGERPIAINLSIGRHAGPHDGSLLIEQAIDWLIVNRPGTVAVQSTGNYYSRNVHTQGHLHEARTIALPFVLPASDPHPATVELWYKGADRFLARAFAPDGSAAVAELGEQGALIDPGGTELARLYHRRRDPNNGDNLIALILRPLAPAGPWRIEITGVDIIDGRWHAWIERNAANPRAQAQFPPRRASPLATTGSICNAMRTIAVGAYDAHDPAHPLALFSSVGPTRDGRRKPLLAAPGVRVLSVRSRQSADEPHGYVRMSGTSMAAPHVTGAAALMLEAAGRQPIAAIRQALFATLDPPGPAPPREIERWGYGILNIEAAVTAARRLGKARLAPAEFLSPHLEEAFAMSGSDFERTQLPIAGPPVTDEERRWTKGRRSTLATPEQRVLSQFSDAELREMLDLPPKPIVVAFADSEEDPASPELPPATAAPEPAPPAPEPPVAAPYHDDPLPPPDPTSPPPEPSPGAIAPYPSPPADPKALLNLAVNPQAPSTQVVGWPGARLAVPLLAGDMILRGRHHRRAKMVRRPDLRKRSELARRAGKPREAGFYAEVFGGEGEERIAGPDGLLLPDVTIVRSLAVHEAESESELPTVPRPTVRFGSRGPVVREAQERLNVVHNRNVDQGGSGLARCPLATDGIFRVNTRAAVDAFQRQAFPDDPRAWDGVLGPKTWAALIAASGLPKLPEQPAADPPPPPPQESPESPAPLYVRQGNNPSDPLDRYRIRGGLYSKQYREWAAFDRSGLILTVGEALIGPEETRLAKEGPFPLTVGKELMRFENGRLGEFVLKFNEFTLHFDEVLRGIGRLRDLLSTGAPEAPTDLTARQKYALRPTDDFQPTLEKKGHYDKWRGKQRTYALMRVSAREHELARHAFWRAHSQLLRTLATNLDKPTFAGISLSLGDVASAVTGGWVGVLVVLGDKAIEAHKARADYDAAIARFKELLKTTKAQVGDETEAMTHAGAAYWDKLERYRQAIQNRDHARIDARKSAAELGQALLSPSQRKDPRVASELRMPPLVSDAWRVLALAGPPALSKVSAILKEQPLLKRAEFHFAKPDPLGTSDLTALLKGFQRARYWSQVLTKDDVQEWIAVDKLWNETFTRFYQ